MGQKHTTTSASRAGLALFPSASEYTKKVTREVYAIDSNDPCAH